MHHRTCTACARTKCAPNVHRTRIQVYLIIFTIEMFSKIIAYGFVWCGNDSAYLTDAWCKLDITVRKSST